MLRLYDRGSWCYVEGSSSDLRKLYSHLVVDIKEIRGGVFLMRRKPLFQPKRRRFPAGLIYMAKRKLKGRVDIKVIDDRSAPCRPKLLDPRFYFLHQYQKTAVSLCQKKTRGILQVATAGGKTLCAVAFAYSLDCPVLFLVDATHLLYQTVEEWEKRTGEKAGIVGDGKFAPARFTVATFQTLHRRRKDPSVGKLLLDAGAFIADECHTTASKTAFNLLMRMENAYWRIGMSATPSGRIDQLDALTVGASGPVIFRRNIADLSVGSEGRRLAKPRVIFFKYPKAEDVEGYWDEVYREGIVFCRKRNIAIMLLAKIAKKPCIIFYHDITNGHGLELKKMLDNRGYSTEIVMGATKQKGRKEAVNRVNTHDVDFLIASSIFNKGVDIPELRSSINAAGFKAPITTMQKLGRGLRLAEGKEDFMMFELWDQHHQSLLRQSVERASTYRDYGVEVVKCSTIGECEEWAKKEVIIDQNLLTRKRILCGVPLSLRGGSLISPRVTIFSRG